MTLRALLVVALLACSSTSYAADCGTVAGWVGVPLCQDASGPLVPTTDVVGEADFAAADALLEGDGLDGLEGAAACSAAAEDSIIRQSPTAGTEVPAGTIVTVTASNGVACVISGRPGVRLPGLRFPGL